jgi:hypothetical protein
MRRNVSDYVFKVGFRVVSQYDLRARNTLLIDSPGAPIGGVVVFDPKSIQDHATSHGLDLVETEPYGIPLA